MTRSNRMEGDVDAIMAKELNKLSTQDRTMIQEEIHGVQSLALEESPQQIEEALRALQNEIDGCDVNDRAAFDQAMACPTSFVHTREWRLQYLRADFFHPKQACKRIMTRLRLVAKYFGTEALERPLRISDFPKQEQTHLRKGHIQILPSRDRAGRLVAFDHESIYASDEQNSTIPCMIRMLLYFTSTMRDDLETQRKGFVVVVAPKASFFEGFQHSTREQQKDSQDLNQSLVPRLSAMHLCLPNGPANRFLRAMVFLGMFAENNRMRIRAHGPLDNVETKYQLMSYGIPVNDMPLTSSGNIKKLNHLQWIKIRKVVEMASDNGVPFDGIVYPGVHDVLFSQGGNVTHSGNQEFRTLLDSTCGIYHETKCKEKRKKVLLQIEEFVTNEWKGRFLQLDPDGAGWWVQITDPNTLYEKISMALYHHNRKVSARKKQQQNACETTSFLDGTKRRKIGEHAFCCDTSSHY